MCISLAVRFWLLHTLKGNGADRQNQNRGSLTTSQSQLTYSIAEAVHKLLLLFSEDWNFNSSTLISKCLLKEEETNATNANVQSLIYWIETMRKLKFPREFGGPDVEPSVHYLYAITDNIVLIEGDSYQNHSGYWKDQMPSQCGWESRRTGAY